MRSCFPAKAFGPGMSGGHVDTTPGRGYKTSGPVRDPLLPGGAESRTKVREASGGVRSMGRSANDNPSDLDALRRRIAELEAAREQQARTEDALRGALFNPGLSFFDTLVTELARATGADHASVGELLPSGTRVRTLALSSGGRIVPGFEYDLDGTPCENVIGKDLCCYPKGVAELFPRDSLIRPGLTKQIMPCILDAVPAALDVVLKGAHCVTVAFKRRLRRHCHRRERSSVRYPRMHGREQFLHQPLALPDLAFQSRGTSCEIARFADSANSGSQRRDICKRSRFFNLAPEHLRPFLGFVERLACIVYRRHQLSPAV